MNARVRSLLVAGAVLVAMLASGPAPALEGPRLFGPTVGTSTTTRPNDVAVQTRVARPDLAAIQRLARHHVDTAEHTRFVLDLFDEAELEAEVISAEVRANGHTVFARLAGMENGSVLLTVEGGVLVGAVSLPGANYAIELQPDGAYRVSLIAPQLFPQEQAPKTVFAPERQDEPFAEPDVPTDSGRLIDVMVVWTPAARAGAGGLPQIQALAQASVDHSNLVYLNSGIAQRLRLVHSQEVAYTERSAGCADPFGGPAGSDAFECALYDITGTADGFMDTVHSLRNTHGADLVAILIQDTAFCGIAWLPMPPGAGTANQGFSVTAQSCAVANKSFVHEAGHNMGAHHDPFVLGGGPCSDGHETGAFCYSRGIVNVPQLWRTVMAYNNQCSPSFCNRIDYFSNPKLSWMGSPMGTAALRNNSHTLNKTAKAIASYRPTSALHPVPQRFSDVATSYPFYGHIEFLAQAGITSGCPGGQYCPSADVTRRQMAVFIERTFRATAWVPPAATGLFSDMPAGSQFRDYVEALRNDGITSGCTTTTYCPDDPVTRAQMAVFLLRARCGAAYVPNAPVTPTFADVPASHVFYRFIEKLYALGITSGCLTGPLRYCPDASATRAQMAVFIERTFPLLVPSEVCAL